MHQISKLPLLRLIIFLALSSSISEGVTLPRPGDFSHHEDYLKHFHLNLNRADFDLEKELDKILGYDNELMTEVKPVFLELLEIGKFDCNTCLSTMSSVDKFLGSAKFEDILFPLATLFCTLAEMFSSRVCKAGVHEWGPHSKF